MSLSEDDILDEIDGGTPTIPIRPAQPSVAPAPEPSPPGPASHGTFTVRHLLFAGIAGIVGTFGVVAALVLFSAWYERSPVPRVDGVALGREFVKPLAGALADGFDAYADAIHGGKTAADSDKALKDTFHASRAKAFAEHAGPALLSIVEDGGEPKDDTQRAALERFHRDFAKGLRSR